MSVSRQAVNNVLPGTSELVVKCSVTGVPASRGAMMFYCIRGPGWFELDVTPRGDFVETWCQNSSWASNTARRRRALEAELAAIGTPVSSSPFRQ